MLKQFEVVLGLGRMANHHEKTYQIEAKDAESAISLARGKYYDEVGLEIGKDAPIWGKTLTVSKCDEIV